MCLHHADFGEEGREVWRWGEAEEDCGALHRGGAAGVEGLLGGFQPVEGGFAASFETALSFAPLRPPEAQSLLRMSGQVGQELVDLGGLPVVAIVGGAEEAGFGGFAGALGEAEVAGEAAVTGGRGSIGRGE